jgi:hypothetical protein
MTNTNQMIRTLLTYGICLPLAVMLGYMLSNPLGKDTIVLVTLVLVVLILPLVLKWHHPALFLVWNTTAVIFLFPGSPNVWMLMAGVSFLVSRIQFILNKKAPPLTVPALSRPLIFLGIVIVVTAMFTGGIGFKALGGETGGGKRYTQLIAALLGYFALSAYRVRPDRANWYVALFFLGGITMAIGSLPHMLPSWCRPLFVIFPVDSWANYVTQESRGGAFRGYGISMAGIMGMLYMLARHGIRDTLSLRQPLKSFCFLLFAFAMLWGGFRSFLLFILGVYVFQFFLEGTHRSPRATAYVGIACLLAVVSIGFSTRMPYTIQRVVSVFGVPVSPEVEMDVRSSNEWRLQMWRDVAPDVPRYLLLGKGYGINVNEMDFTSDRILGGNTYDSAQGAKLAQDYHSGPLSVILPLGLWGVAAVIWLWVAGIKALVANLRYGSAALKTVNSLLLAAFVVKILHFLVIFGSLTLDLAWFTGILGVSVALNGGVAQSQPVAAPQPAAERDNRTNQRPATTHRPPPLRPAVS